MLEVTLGLFPQLCRDNPYSYLKPLLHWQFLRKVSWGAAPPPLFSPGDLFFPSICVWGTSVSSSASSMGAGTGLLCSIIFAEQTIYGWRDEVGGREGRSGLEGKARAEL